MIHDSILRAGERHQCPSCQRHQMLEEKARGLLASATALPAACQHLPALLAPSCVVQPLIQPNPAQISAHSSLLEAASHTTQGCKAGGGEELPAQIRIPYLGRAGGEAENPHNTDANNCKKQQGNGQDDPEGPGGSWEVCCGPLVLGARAKEGGTGVKIDPSADSSSSNVFPAHETNPCANWLVCRAAKPLQHLE